MSTALWLYFSDGETVSSDEEDLLFLYRHAAKLDRLCRKLALTPISEFHDLTDARFNLEDEELPHGMSDTTELMLQTGTWHPVAEGLATLSALLRWLRANPTRFGVFSDHYPEIVEELTMCVDGLTARDSGGRQFNLCVVL